MSKLQYQWRFCSAHRLSTSAYVCFRRDFEPEKPNHILLMTVVNPIYPITVVSGNTNYPIIVASSSGQPNLHHHLSHCNIGGGR